MREGVCVCVCVCVCSQFYCIGPWICQEKLTPFVYFVVLKNCTTHFSYKDILKHLVGHSKEMQVLGNDLFDRKSAWRDVTDVTCSEICLPFSTLLKKKQSYWKHVVCHDSYEPCWY